MFKPDRTHTWIGMMLIGVSAITTTQMIYSFCQWFF